MALIERDLSASHLSIMAGLGSSTLSNLLKRNNIPTVSTLMRICAVLGVRLSEFIRDLEDRHPEIFLEALSGVKRHDPLSRRKQQLLADWAALPVSDQGETLRRMRETYAAAGGTWGEVAEGNSTELSIDNSGKPSIGDAEEFSIKGAAEPSVGSAAKPSIGDAGKPPKGGGRGGRSAGSGKAHK